MCDTLHLIGSPLRARIAIVTANKARGKYGSLMNRMLQPGHFRSFVLSGHYSC